MVNKLTPVEFMHQFMYKLSHDFQENHNKLDLTLEAMTTGIDGQPVIHNSTELKNAIKADIATVLSNEGTAKDFLKQKCNIDLDNEDIGSLLGFDCSGGDIKTNDNIINETVELKNHTASAIINGCTLTFPSYNDNKRTFVIDGLYTWWIPLAFQLIEESYGLKYTSDSFVTSMDVDLYDEAPQNGAITGAYVETYYTIATGIPTSQHLRINMNDAAFGTIIIGDKSGNCVSTPFGCLDRTLAHELTHAVMGTNIQGSSFWMPKWFVEGGSAVLSEGCDDTRTNGLLGAVINTSNIDNGFSDSPAGTNEYAVGFMAIRYLLANYCDKAIKIIFPSNPLEPFEIMWQKNAHGIKSEFCISRDADLNKIMNEFSDFVQRDDYNEVQPWDLIRDNNMGKTFRIPIKDYETSEEDVVADFLDYPSDINKDESNTELVITTMLERNGKDRFFAFPCDSDCKRTNTYIYDINGLSQLSGRVIESYLSDYLVKSTEEIINLVRSERPSRVRILLQGVSVFAIGKDFFKSLRKICPVYVFQMDLIPLASINYEEISDSDFIKYFNNYYLSNEDISLINSGLFGFCDIKAGTISALQSVRISLSSFGYPNLSLAQLYKHCFICSDTEFIYSNKAVAYDDEINICIGRNSLFKGTEFNCPMSPIFVVEHYLYFEHRIGIKVVESLSEDLGFFHVSETENKKFPCFYLSTGVFKPKDWVNEGLRYPEHVIKGENQNDEYIPFNIHVLYDKNMRFDLQGQGTAKRTTGAKGNAYILDGVEGNPDSGYYPIESDAIPGIGCPMIVRSQENKITYPYIECYFTKTSYSGTVTLIFYSADNEAQNPVFQSVAFGLGKSEESSYKYPLYTAGGSCGLYPYGYTFTWTDTGRPPSTHHIYIGGQKINFDMSKGESLSSLLYPCGIEDSNISNVRIMQPDGRWVSAKNFMQTQETMNGTCGSMLTKSDIESSTLPMIYPTISDIDNVDRFTFTQPVMVIRKRVDEEDESGFTLAFDGIKAKADRLRAIFTAKDGHEYLSVPNGWYSRTFGIPYTTGAAESGENILDVIARLNKNMPKQNYVLTIDLG